MATGCDGGSDGETVTGTDRRELRGEAPGGPVGARMGKDGRIGHHTAYGVEPGRRAPFELRQARYEALATTGATEVARIHEKEGRPADLLDVGVNNGVSLRYLEPKLGGREVRLNGVDLFPYGMQVVYRRDDWTLRRMDLEAGMPDLPSDAFDLVICEQVLEHLRNYRPLLRDLERVVRPGGLLIVGVPTFPFGIHRFRPLLVRLQDRLFGSRDHDHVQAFSLRSLKRELATMGEMRLVEARGFRITSGGPLRPLEFKEWWWRLNQWIGARVPGLCIEVQVLLRKGGERGAGPRSP